MGKNNKQGQANRSKRGRAFEQKCFSRIVDVIENYNLDSEFEVIPQFRKGRIQLPNGFYISPDIIIVDKKTGNHRIYFSCKTCWRERWRSDDRDVRALYSITIPWIEITEQEKEYKTSPLERIRNSCATAHAESLFFATVSALDPDNMSIMFDKVRQILLGTKVLTDFKDGVMSAKSINWARHVVDTYVKLIELIENTEKGKSMIQGG